MFSVETGACGPNKSEEKDNNHLEEYRRDEYISGSHDKVWEDVVVDGQFV
jgi:hypothetical protein